MTKLTSIALKNFTAFREIDITLGKGINVFIGANATGKTHLLKLLYAACDTTVVERDFLSKVLGVFRPVNDSANLLHQSAKRGSVCIDRQDGTTTVNVGLFDFTISDGVLTHWGEDNAWRTTRMDSVFIPAKDMLAHSKGFISWTELHKTSFEDVYPDLIKRALLPELQELPSSTLKDLQHRLENIINGKVYHENETFFLQNANGSLELSLIAEGLRKFALLLVLINNGMLKEGSFLFWDEPEANINPSLLGAVADILLTLEDVGVQIFIATHNYVLLKELELRRKTKHEIVYHGLFRDADSQNIRVQSEEGTIALVHNPILDAYAGLYAREMEDMRLGRVVTGRAKLRAKSSERLSGRVVREEGV